MKSPPAPPNKEINQIQPTTTTINPNNLPNNALQLGKEAEVVVDGLNLGDFLRDVAFIMPEKVNEILKLDPKHVHGWILDFLRRNKRNLAESRKMLGGGWLVRQILSLEAPPQSQSAAKASANSVTNRLATTPNIAKPASAWSGWLEAWKSLDAQPKEDYLSRGLKMAKDAGFTGGTANMSAEFYAKALFRQEQSPSTSTQTLNVTANV